MITDDRDRRKASGAILKKEPIKVFVEMLKGVP